MHFQVLGRVRTKQLGSLDLSLNFHPAGTGALQIDTPMGAGGATGIRSGLSDYQLLTTIPGIGPINAMTILAEAGDLRRFHHHRKFLKFCGMDLATVQSGMFRGQRRISKYGNARLRRTLWTASQTAGTEAEQQLPRQVRALYLKGSTQCASASQGL